MKPISKYKDTLPSSFMFSLKELEENANVIRYTREMEKARSTRKLVDMKVAMARVQQSQAELTRIKYYINQANVNLH